MNLVKPLSPKDWKKWRELGLGSSDAPIIMNTSKWDTPLGLWERRTGRREEKPTNWQMARGLRLEGDAREFYEQLIGVAMPKQLGVHEVHDWLRASFDGWNGDAQRAIEIKCPGKPDHQLACAGKIPEHYLWQLVHLLLVSDLPVVDYVSYNEHTLAIVPFYRSLELEGQLIKKELQFWQYIVNDIAPPDPRGKPEVFKVRRNRR